MLGVVVVLLLEIPQRGVELLAPPSNRGVATQRFAPRLDVADLRAGARGGLDVAGQRRVKAAGPLMIAGGRQYYLGAGLLRAATIAELQRQRRQRSGRLGL